MTRKSKREIERELEDLQASRAGEIEIVSSSVMTVTEDGPEETDPPPNGTLVPTESPVVTWYKLDPDAGE